MSEIDPVLLRDIETAADHAYRRAAAGVPDVFDIEKIHYQPACISVSQFLVRKLADKGHSFKTTKGTGRPTQTYDELGLPLPLDRDAPRFSHTYCYQPFSRPRLIVDPTWQQFLDPELRNEGLPRVMIGPEPEVIDRLREAGITQPGMLELWVNRPELDLWHLGNASEQTT